MKIRLLKTFLTLSICLLTVGKPAQAQRWCAKIDNNFCPGNYFKNGNFDDSLISNPNDNRHTDIGAAYGWEAMWKADNTMADLFCPWVHTVGTAPSPNVGVYAGMWIVNQSNAGGNANFREGMYNKLTTTIPKNSGSYTFTFDLANSKYSDFTGTLSIGIYGVFNPNNTLANVPTSTNNPTNENLWLSVDPNIRVVMLGSLNINCSVLSNQWQSQSITFNSGDLGFPNTGISHIMITNNTSFITTPYGKEYFYFDNFCMQRDRPGIKCCSTQLAIWNVFGTPNPLLYTSQTVSGQNVTVASETFEIHQNSTIPITELRVSTTDIQFESNHAGCAQCVANPAVWGSLFSATTHIGSRSGGLAQHYNTIYASSTISSMVGNQSTVREVIWSNPAGSMLRAGDLFEVSYVLPPVSDIPCCVTGVRICSKISWKDANCNVCEVYTCSNVELRRKAPGKYGSSINNGAQRLIDNKPNKCDIAVIGTSFSGMIETDGKAEITGKAELRNEKNMLVQFSEIRSGIFEFSNISKGSYTIVVPGKSSFKIITGNDNSDDDRYKRDTFQHSTVFLIPGEPLTDDVEGPAGVCVMFCLAGHAYTLDCNWENNQWVADWYSLESAGYCAGGPWVTALDIRNISLDTTSDHMKENEEIYSILNHSHLEVSKGLTSAKKGRIPVMDRDINAVGIRHLSVSAERINSDVVSKIKASAGIVQSIAGFGDILDDCYGPAVCKVFPPTDPKVKNRKINYNESLCDIKMTPKGVQITFLTPPGEQNKTLELKRDFNLPNEVSDIMGINPIYLIKGNYTIANPTKHLSSVIIPVDLQNPAAQLSNKRCCWVKATYDFWYKECPCGGSGKPKPKETK